MTLEVSIIDKLKLPFSQPQLLSQALEACAVGVVIADAQQGDFPVVYVNSAFERLSGYAAAEIIGRNCRFLQQHDRDQDARREIRAALEQGQSVTSVLRNYRKDGTMFYNELTLSPITDASGTVTHFVGFQNDVTVREEALRGEVQARAQLSATLSRMTDGFMSFDKDWNFTYINEAASRISGRRPEDFLGRNLLTSFPEFSSLAVGQAVRQAEATGRTQSAVSYMPPFGRWVELTAYPGDDGISLFTRDVTESQEALRERQISEERFSKVFETSPVAIFITRRKDRHFLDVNDEFLRQSGFSRAEVIGRSSQELDFWIEQSDREVAWSMLDGLQPAHNREVRFRNKSGAEIYGVLSIIPMEMAGEACAIGFVRDITQEKRALQQLEDSEKRARQIATELQHTLDLSLDLIASTGPDLRFITVSAACERVLGYAPEEMIGRSAAEFIHPDDLAAALAEGQHVRSGRTTTAFQNRFLHKGGRVVWLEWSAVAVPEEGVMYSVARDITERRAAEEDRAFLAAIVQASHNAIVGLSLDGTIRSWNPGAEELYGYTAAEVIGKPVNVLVPAEFHAAENELIARAKQGRRDPPFEGLRLTKSGQQIFVNATISPVLDAAGEVIGVSKITRDITPLRQAEQEIQLLNEGLTRQLRHVTGLREIDQSIAASADLGVTLNLVLDNVCQQLDVDATVLQLRDPHSLKLEYAAARGLTTALRHPLSRLGESLAGQVALKRQPLLIADLQVADLHTADVSPAWRRMLDQERIMAYYAAPIMAKGKVLGVLEVLHRQPFEPSAAWLETFEVLINQAAIATENAQLFQELERRNLELRLAYDETIEGWARALDLRDKETEGHSRRVTEMTVALCQRLGAPPDQLVQVRRGALLHDIGKMGIPDAVLLKPGKLSGDEWDLMKKHPEYAVDLLSPIGFLRPALDIPQYHHERWDGLGYPLGLSGKAIPITARAFAVVDVYDALTSDRPYRNAWTRERAITHIQNSAGSHFDPTVVQVFTQMLQGP